MNWFMSITFTLPAIKRAAWTVGGSGGIASAAGRSQAGEAAPYSETQSAGSKSIAGVSWIGTTEMP